MTNKERDYFPRQAIPVKGKISPVDVEGGRIPYTEALEMMRGIPQGALASYALNALIDSGEIRVFREGDAMLVDSKGLKKRIEEF